MQIITKAEVRLKKEEILDRIENGELFIHPTDTIYGLGCDATNAEAVKKIRAIKERPDTPFSVIAPSTEWVNENCKISKQAEKHIKELPGPVTLILPLKNKNCIAKEVNVGKGSVGVRMPAHWISGMVETLGLPIITTSVNKTDRKFMTEIEDLDPEIKSDVSFALYEGKKEGRPSKIIHLEGKETKIRER